MINIKFSMYYHFIKTKQNMKNDMSYVRVCIININDQFAGRAKFFFNFTLIFEV